MKIEDIATFTIEGPVVRSELGPCLDWTRCTNDAGYPLARIDGKMQRLNRVILEQTLGRPIGFNLCALHVCDRPICIRQNHLREGTRKDNAADYNERFGNTSKRPDVRAKISAAMRTESNAIHRSDVRAKLSGENHYYIKLTASDVLEIRQRRAAGEIRATIAVAFGISEVLVSRIALRRIWKSVP